MNNKTIILAEKPSVARDIARIVGADKKEEGYLSGNGYTVTWAIGHLCTHAMPEAYGYTRYNTEDLPIIPDPFLLTVRQIRGDKGYKDDPGAKKQLSVIKKLFSQSGNIVVATDAGREGELIFRFIYEYLGCTKPFKRLWISSLTDKAIREGLDNLKSGSEYDLLYQSGKARSEADWLVGINASRALSIAAGSGSYSLGRVQTPTLAMICRRADEYRNFRSKPYWKIVVETQKDGVTQKAVHSKQYQTFAAAVAAFRTVEVGGMVCVEKIESKIVKEEPPLLFDLTSLQKEANKKHGFSADETLQTAQKLYENKFITYPRTGSCYISYDVFDEIAHLLSVLEAHPRFGEYARSLRSKTLNKRSVNVVKVTDHHALLPTEQIPEDIGTKENIIYNMIVSRTLEAFSEVSLKERTLAYCVIGNLDALITGDKLIQQGWKSVVNEKTSDDDEESVTDNLPHLQEGEHLPITLHKITEHQTQPKPLYTEASLLSAMETAGKEVEDEEARSAMKDCGLGTPATRASIIETLITRGYIVREKKSLIPTDKGQSVYAAVKDKQIADAAMTGNWEATLAQIENGKLHPDTFRQSIRIYTGQITRELLSEKATAAINPLYTCPLCKNTTVQVYPKIAKCVAEDCGFKLFRTICGKTLTEKEIAETLEKGISPLLNGLSTKTGKTFNAHLRLQPDGATSLRFDSDTKKKKK